MRIKLLTDGNYGDMENVIFPVEVEAQEWCGVGFDILGSEIIRVGGDPEAWNPEAFYYWHNGEVIPQ